MKRFLALAAVLLPLLAAPAFAGTFTITVQVGSPAVTYTFTKTIADSDLTGKFAPWIEVAYPTTCSPSPCSPGPTTPATAYAQWGTATLQGTVNNVQSYEQQQVQANALTASPVVPIAAQ